MDLLHAIQFWQEEMPAERRHWEVFERFVSENTTDPQSADFSRVKLATLATRTRLDDKERG